MLQAFWILSAVLPVLFGAPAETNDDKGQIWAVLVAGANGYDNYGIQADVCHAYQLLHSHGIPDSNIIVMMYDDIANNPENPYKGIVINKPDGKDVYKGVPKDYTGDDVSPENFIKVLTGDNGTNKKVLKSGPNDHVFVFYVDHGTQGMIAFPTGVLHAHKLIQTLETMHKKKMYKELLFYLDASESGSMFHNHLPENIEIIATTSANPVEPAYFCYWDNTTKAYVGTAYSVGWMEDTEHNYRSETLEKQFSDVKLRVRSHPQMYGEKKFQKDLVIDFLGGSKTAKYKSSASQPQPSPPQPFEDIVSSRDVSLEVLNRRIIMSSSNDEMRKLQKKRDALIKSRNEVDQLFTSILAHVTNMNSAKVEELKKTRPTLSMEMMPCYQNLVDNFSKNCVNISKNTYTLGHLYTLANLCIANYPADNVLGAFSATCSDHHRALVAVN